MAPATKGSPLYLVWRVVWVAAFLAVQLLGIGQILDPDYAAGVPLYVPIMTLLSLPILFMFFNACVFKFSFSIFGKYIRTP